MTQLVRPQTLRGFRDILPDEMLLRNEVTDRIRKVYESYGFVPVDTPVLEPLRVLFGAGGDEADRQIFQLQTPEQQDVGMRFDLTVPFARLVAQYHPHLVRLPFRRYHIGPVFRADDPQPEQGRFRQFTQFDVDIAGTTSVAADAEIVAVMDSAFQALGLRPELGPQSDPESGAGNPAYVIRVNSRRLMDAFLAGIGVTGTRTTQVLRVLDKRDKISDDEMAAELADGRYDRSGDRIPGLGLGAEPIKAILEFVGVQAPSRAEVVETLLGLVRPGEAATAATAEVTQLLAHLDALGIDEAAARFDPSLARGLDYYTGTVYEGTIGHSGVGSVMGGGRYDDLVSRFLEVPVPAVGASIGLDRLVTGLRSLQMTLGTTGTSARVLVLMMPAVAPALASSLARELRAAGVAAELYVGEAVGKVGRQLAFANARGFDVAVMAGQAEAAAGTVTVKDLRLGLSKRSSAETYEEFRSAGSTGQVTCPRSELVREVTRILAAGQPATRES